VSRRCSTSSARVPRPRRSRGGRRPAQGEGGVTADGVDAIPYHAVRAAMGLAHEGGYVTPLDLAKVLELIDVVRIQDRDDRKPRR
jgi:hypothetical protein